jgi:hypothetical protein
MASHGHARRLEAELNELDGRVEPAISSRRFDRISAVAGDDFEENCDNELCDRCMRVVSEISHTEDEQTVCPDCAGE